MPMARVPTIPAQLLQIFHPPPIIWNVPRDRSVCCVRPRSSKFADSMIPLMGPWSARPSSSAYVGISSQFSSNENILTWIHLFCHVRLFCTLGNLTWWFQPGGSNVVCQYLMLWFNWKTMTISPGLEEFRMQTFRQILILSPQTQLY
jgi:hypothetical protein